MWPNRTLCCLYCGSGGADSLLGPSSTATMVAGRYVFPPSKPSVRPWCVSSLMSANAGTTRARVRAWEREGCRDGTGTVMRHIQLPAGRSFHWMPDRKTDSICLC